MKKVACYEGFDIFFEAQKETESMRHHFVDTCGWSKEEYASLAQSKPKWFCAHVVAKKGGIELGEAYLGACCYKTHKEFYTTYYSNYFKDMMHEAVAEAKKRLPIVLKELKVKASTLSKSIGSLESIDASV